jgi:hypothetical protein
MDRELLTLRLPMTRAALRRVTLVCVLGASCRTTPIPQAVPDGNAESSPPAPACGESAPCRADSFCQFEDGICALSARAQCSFAPQLVPTRSLAPSAAATTRPTGTAACGKWQACRASTLAPARCPAGPLPPGPNAPPPVWYANRPETKRAFASGRSCKSCVADPVLEYVRATCRRTVLCAATWIETRPVITDPVSLRMRGRASARPTTGRANRASVRLDQVASRRTSPRHLSGPIDPGGAHRLP